MATSALVGVDITSIDRVDQLRRRRPRFVERVYTEAEQQRCASRPERWATRWAAKEAVRKLATAAGVPLPSWRDVEVTMSDEGAPSARVAGWAEAVSLSLSHEGDTAVAVATLRQPPLQATDIADVVLPPRGRGAHKGTFGRVVIAAGSMSYSGAPYLAAMGAARGGAGLVQLLVPEPIFAAVAAKCSEVIVTAVPDDNGSFGTSLWRFIDDTPHASALVIGCGFSQSLGAQRALTEVVTRTTLPIVVDADGLNIAASKGLEWHSHRGGPVVLTPHPAEMARLCGMDTGAVQENREEVARDYAQRHDVVVVLKGAHTVVAAPDGRCRVDAHDVVALATGGTGDVFAGLVGSMLAQGLGAFDAAVAAVAIHVEAGMAAQRQFGRAGVVASDLLGELPRAQERIRTALELRA